MKLLRANAVICAATLLLACVGFLQAEQLKYDSHGKRDPFVPLIGPERAAVVTGFSEIATIDEVRLEGIALRKGGRTAIINGEIVKEGFKAGEVQVVKIGKDSVTLMITDKEYTVKLPEEGGRIE